MDTARDLANAALWQKSLERSLARRGKQTRSSLELYRLRPERDLVYGDFIRESALYSQMRRSARSRPSMALPTAGGISALALLAATTIPSLLDGNGGAGHERVAYRADRSAARLRRATAHAAVADASVAAPNSAAPSVGAIEGVGAMPSRNAVSTTGASTSNAARAKAVASSTRSSGSPATHRHIALARDASAGHDVSGGVVARVASGGAAPARPVISAASPRVPAAPSPPRHPSTGGGAIQERSAIRAIRPVPKESATAAPTHLRTSTHPTAVALTHTHVPVRSKPVAASKPAAHPHPAAPARPKPAAHPHPAAPARPKPVAHPHPVAPAKPKPVAHPHPAAPVKPRPVAAPKPAPKPRPVAKPKPVAVAKPAPKPAPPAAPVAPGHYVNPLAGASVTPERIDQGVDYSGSGTLSALGAGRVTYVSLSGTGWPGAFIEYRLTEGADSGRYVYYAEGVSPAGGLHVGETLQAGQPVAEIVPGSGTGIEIGWGSGLGTQTLAEANGDWGGSDDADSVPSPEGKDFSALIASLGGPPGKIEG